MLREHEASAAAGDLAPRRQRQGATSMPFPRTCRARAFRRDILYPRRSWWADIKLAVPEPGNFLDARRPDQWSNPTLSAALAMRRES